MCPHSSSCTKYVFAFYNLLCVSVCVISVYIWVYLVWGVWDKEGGNRAVAHHSSYVRCFSQSAWQERCKVHREFQDMFRGGKRLPSLTQSWNSCSRGDTPRHAHFLIRTQCFSLLYNRLSKINTLLFWETDAWTRSSTLSHQIVAQRLYLTGKEQSGFAEGFNGILKLELGINCC